MTSKLTRERLEKIKSWRETYGAGSNVMLPAEEAEELASIALAAMDSEPVAWTWQHLKQWHVTNDEARARDLAWDGVKVEPLYRHAQQPVVPEKATVGEMPFLGTSEGAYVRGWNDCRAAMLQENAKSAGVSNNCRSSENVQVMQDHQIRELVNQLRDIAVKYHAAGQLREQIARVIRAAMLQAGNSPVIPDGWTGNEKANAALMMLDRIETVDPVDDDRIDGIKRIVRELAAAPHDTPALNSVQSVDSVADRWIPVSERMPENDGAYLCWDNRYVTTYAFIFGAWQANQFIAKNITHWMPLPAGPQEVR